MLPSGLRNLFCDMPLPPRKIGSSEIHPIGFGAMGISAFYGKVDSDEERFKVLRLPIMETESLSLAQGLGCCIGEGMQSLGYLKHIRRFGRIDRQMVGYLFRWSGLSTYVCTGSNGPESATTFLLQQNLVSLATLQIPGATLPMSGSAASSLQRLGVDCIDLYYIHR